MNTDNGSKDWAAERLAFVESCVNESTETKGLARSTLWSLLQLNMDRIRSGNYANVVSSLNQLIRETQSPAAYLMLAEAQIRLGQGELALVTLDVLTYVEPNVVEARVMRGLILREQGAIAEAREALHSVARERTPLPSKWKNLIDKILGELAPYDTGPAHRVNRIESAAPEPIGSLLPTRNGVAGAAQHSA